MDTVGRTTLNLVAINVVDELRERDLIVTYEYPSSAKYRKPFALAGGLFVLFVLCWIVGNLDVSIGKKQKQKTV
jgi:oligosaccharyltransferase complex subunit alpha (ribophorin I)